MLDEIDPKWKFRSLDGDTLALAAFKGKKMFINFWATWCAPCLAEMWGLQSLYDTFKSDITYAFFFISDEDEKTVHSFLSKSTYTLPVYLCEKMRAPGFNTGAYPSTFIVNSRGQIVYKKLETAKWNHKSVIDFLNLLP
ncbi:MAG: TlpA family protein disulfide reductase [Ignavibacteriales bacterium]|nr:TlpA family protein disulfide reductase [Ignavibacteriales bacterium]